MIITNSQPVRIIPRLDIKSSNLVKGIRLEGLRVMGSPEIFAKFYYENGADELFFQDVVASLYERNNLTEIIQKVASEVYIPLSVGGGIRSLDNIYTILRSGADKVSINTAALSNPNFIKEASINFGSSTISVSIEAIMSESGKYFACSDNGRNRSDYEVIDWSKKVQDLGAGEIILTMVDKEGTGNGYDLGLVEEITKNINIPLIIHGGTGNKHHVNELFKKNCVSGISIASMFHYYFLNKDKKNNVSKNSYNFRNNKNIEPLSIDSLKKFLSKNGIPCRNEK